MWLVNQTSNKLKLSFCSKGQQRLGLLFASRLVVALLLVLRYGFAFFLTG